MQRMKKRHMSAVGKALSVLGLMLCLTSALSLGNGERFELGKLAPQESVQPYIAHFTWDLSRPMNHMRVLGTGELTDPALQTGAFCTEVTLRTLDGQLVAEMKHSSASPQYGVVHPYLTDKQAPTWRAELLRAFERKQPNGQRHIIRHVLLICEKPGRDAQTPPTVFLQQLEVDATLGSVDAMPCTPPARYAQLPGRDYYSAAPTGLPEKINGSSPRREMLQLLYALAAIDSPEMAALAAQELGPFAWKLAAKAPAPRKPWPHCWGDAAEDAKSIALKLTATLVFLQENQCFECADLAAFINSPVFERIFGTRFTQQPYEKVQQEKIIYEKTKP